jgi:hypothetical protein
MNFIFVVIFRKYDSNQDFEIENKEFRNKYSKNTVKFNIKIKKLNIL